MIIGSSSTFYLEAWGLGYLWAGAVAGGKLKVLRRKQRVLIGGFFDFRVIINGSFLENNSG